jgi:hypothetical protein
LCAQADIRARSELIIEERRRQEAFHSAHPSMSVFDISMPWNSVLKAAASDSEFWDRELKEPAMLYMVGHGRAFPSHVERLPEQPATAAAQTANRKCKRPRGGGEPQRQQQSSSSGKGKDHGKGRGKGRGAGGDNPKRTSAGRYTTDRQGKQLCFQWCRTPGGCTTGQCPNGRSHLCEICLQPHRTIDHKGGEGGTQEGGQRHS